MDILNNNVLSNLPPKVRLISDDLEATVIEIDLAGFRINEFFDNGKVYQAINIGDQAITSKTGFPEIPYIAKILAIPDESLVNVEVLQKSDPQIIKEINIPYARENWIEGETETA